MSDLVLPWKKQEMSIVVSENRASVQWRIKDFPRIDAKCGDCLESGTFQFLSAMWNITMYPNGEDESDVGDVHLFLFRTESCIPVQNVKLKFSYRDNFAHDYLSTEDSQKYDENTGHGPESFILIEDLLNGPLRELLLKDDVLTVCCEVRDAEEEEDALEGEDCSISNLDALFRDFGEICKDEGSSDIRLKIGKTEFPAHKVVLKARSAVFASIFKERSSIIIELDDVDESIGNSFLSYLYSGRVEEITSANVPKLFAAAQAYSLKELQMECLKYMKSNFSVNNVCDFAKTAFKYKNNDLITMSKIFFTKNFPSVISSKKWSTFVEEWPAVATDLLKLYDFENETATDSPSDSLSRDFEALYNNPESADLSLRVGDKVFPAHKLVLSVRSRVFEAMFKNDSKESRENTILLREMEEDTVQRMLEYIYCGKVRDLTPDNALQLYVAADRYDMLELKNKCRYIVLGNLSVKNICEVVNIADVHSDKEFEVAVKHFLINNLKEVMKTDQWNAFAEERPAFLLKRIKQIILNE